MSDDNSDRLIKRRDFQLGLGGGFLATLLGVGGGTGATMAMGQRQQEAADRQETPIERDTPEQKSDEDEPDEPTFDPRERELDETLDLLRDGGYILYFRHEMTQGGTDQYKNVDDADRPEDLPEWAYDDCGMQRNLSIAGVRRAERVGETIRELGIPVGTVLSSPFCRCNNHAEAAFDEVEATHDLNFAREDIASRVSNRLQQSPEDGTNTVYVAHTLSSMGIDEQLIPGTNLSEGECVVVDPEQPLEEAAVRFISPDEFFESLAE